MTEWTVEVFGNERNDAIVKRCCQNFVYELIGFEQNQCCQCRWQQGFYAHEKNTIGARMDILLFRLLLIFGHYLLMNSDNVG